MTLTVETGAGSATADAFVSVTDCDTFCTNRGLTDWTGEARSPADDDEAAIRRATAFISTAFSYKGSRMLGRSQALAFPRQDCTDAEGEDIGADEVPVEIVQATCIVAAYERANPGAMSPAVDMTARIEQESVGPISVKYAYAQQTPEAARPVLLQVLDLIGGLLSTSSNPLVGTSVRS